MSPITSISEAVDRLEKICPFLKPLYWTRFDSLFVFQVADSDGNPIVFDNLIAVDPSSGTIFPFNPLKYGKEYVDAAKEFVAL